jgi:hypothetical protein
MKALLFILFASIVAKADPVKLHGMNVFGDKTTYASHMPIYHFPHNYQVIYQIKLVDSPNVPTLFEYQASKSSGVKIFSVKPEPLDLTRIISGELKEFKGELYTGNFFEDSAKDLGPITVKIQKLIFSKKLDQTEQELDFQYVLFGQNGEYYAAHVIKGVPAFDQIVSIEQPYIYHHIGRGFDIETIEDSALPVTTSHLLQKSLATPVENGEVIGDESLPQASVIDAFYLNTEDFE